MFEGYPAGVNSGSDLQRHDNGDLVQTDCISLDQTSGRLMPDSSLSAYLEHNKIWGKFPGNNHSNFRCTIKLKT